MKKINLQLFAKLNEDTSIVDYLKGQGQDSSYSAREGLAASLGISNYTGTAEQNAQMLKSLKNQSSSGSQSNTGTTQKSAGQPVQNSPSQPAQSSQFTASTAYQNAMAQTNELLKKLSSGRTSYTDQLKGLMEQIQGREDFFYDVESDPLFQQMLASAMGSGKTAMQDTIGQASALTGGYGSTYATTAGNQAYNAYIKDAYDNLPEYYQLALEAYEMEGQEMYQELAMLNEADATEYGRLYNAWNANQSNAQQIYQNEYSAWQSGIDNYYNMASLKQRQYEFEQEMAYKNAALALEQIGDNVLKEPSQDMMLEALEAYNTGGDEALDRYIDALPSNIDVDRIGRYIYGYVNENGEEIKGFGVLPLQYQNWLIEDDTDNWGFVGGDDNDDTYKYGEDIKTFKELEKLIQATELSDEEKKEWLDKLREQSKR